MHRVALSLGSGLVVAVLMARTVLPVAVRLLAKHATPELYQLTVVAFCLCSGWVSGYMVRSHRLMHQPAQRFMAGMEPNGNVEGVLNTLKPPQPAALEVCVQKPRVTCSLRALRATSRSQP